MTHKLNLVNVLYSEDELDKNAHLFDPRDWDYVTYFQAENISENFIEKWGYKMNFGLISAIYVLSEPFMERWSNKINWYCVSGNQKLSEKFIRKHFDKLNFVQLMNNFHISNKTKEEIKLLKEII